MGVYWDVLWCTKVYWDVLWCTKVYWDVLWCTKVYWDVLWCTKVYCGLSECTSLGEEVDFSKYMDSNVLTSVLKLFLRELPIPVISHDAYSEVMKATGEGVCLVRVCAGEGVPGEGVCLLRVW